MTTRRRLRLRTAVAGLLVLLVLLGLAVVLGTGACDDDAERRREHQRQYEKVLADPHPAVADVVRVAGAPSAVARAADGATLLTYFAPGIDDDEGPAVAAWRLYGPDGEQTAEGTAAAETEAGPPAVSAAGDGFLVVPGGGGTDGAYVLDDRGRKHAVRGTEGRRTPERGDVPVRQPYGTLLYRPSDRTLSDVGGLPENVLEPAVDANGAVWGLDPADGTRKGRSLLWSDGGERHRHELPRGYRGLAVAARSGTVVVALERVGGDHVRALHLTDDGGRSWRTVRTTGQAPLGSSAGSGDALELDVLADGRVLVGLDGTGPHWITGPDKRSFREIDAPGADEAGDSGEGDSGTGYSGDGSGDSAGAGSGDGDGAAARPRTDVIAAGRRTLFATVDAAEPGYGLVEDEGLWVATDDSGRHWERFDDGREDGGRAWLPWE